MLSRIARKVPSFESAESRWGIGATAYALFLLYGSLYPFSGWTPPTSGVWDLWVMSLSRRLSRSDLLTNLVLYVPFGFAAILGFGRRSRQGWAYACVVAVGAGLSGFVETAQAWLPTRVPSVVDFGLNVAGTAGGALLGGAVARTCYWEFGFCRLRERWLVADPLARWGVGAFGLWAVSRLSPFVPSLDLGSLRAGARPIWHVLRGGRAVDPMEAATYAAGLCGLAGLAALVVLPGRPRVRFFASVVGAVLLLKVTVVTRTLTVEEVLGFFSAFVFLWGAVRVRRSAAAVMSVAGLALAFFLHQARPWSGLVGQGLEAMNWVPFGRSHLDIRDVANIADLTWPALGAAVALRLGTGVGGRRWAVVTTLVVFAVALGMEWVQRWLPGRTPDVTGALLPALAWALPWTVGWVERNTNERRRA